MAHGHGIGSDGGGFCGGDFGNGHAFYGGEHVGHMEFAGIDTVEALVVAFALSEHSGSTAGHVSTGVSVGGFAADHMSADGVGAAFKAAANDGKKDLGLVMLRHGYIDLEQTVRSALAKAGLLEVLAVPQGYRKRVKETTTGIKPLRPATKTAPAVMPNGWKPGMEGLTTQWRSFHQVAERSLIDKVTGGRGVLPRKCATMLEVEVLQNYFSDGTYETRIAVHVHSQMMYNRTVGDYLPRSEELNSHLKAAASLCESMATRFAAAKL